MNIQRYQPEHDRRGIDDLIRVQGGEWSEYLNKDRGTDHGNALAGSTTYVARTDDRIVGYLRAAEDHGLGVYVYELLVHPAQRRKGTGRALLERVKQDFSPQAVYILSDPEAKGYYQKLGFGRIGTVYQMR